MLVGGAYSSFCQTVNERKRDGQSTHKVLPTHPNCPLHLQNCMEMRKRYQEYTKGDYGSTVGIQLPALQLLETLLPETSSLSVN